MIQCGELCKSCGNQCAHDYKEGITIIECPICDGIGTIGKTKCKSCKNGELHLTECPRTMVDAPMVSAINLAAMSGNEGWPVAGGFLDQSAWFMDLKKTLENDRNKIESERMGKDDGA